MSNLLFSPDGSTVALQARGEFCLMYDADEESVHPPRPAGVGASRDSADSNDLPQEWESQGLSFVREEEEDDEAG
jgi:hypothetical protein